MYVAGNVIERNSLNQYALSREAAFFLKCRMYHDVSVATFACRLTSTHHFFLQLFHDFSHHCGTAFTSHHAEDEAIFKANTVRASHALIKSVSETIKTRIYFSKEINAFPSIFLFLPVAVHLRAIQRIHSPPVPVGSAHDPGELLLFRRARNLLRKISFPSTLHCSYLLVELAERTRLPAASSLCSACAACAACWGTSAAPQ